MYIASKTLWTVVLSIFFVHCTVVTASNIPSIKLGEPRPLNNLGNTCYINAMLQALIPSPLTAQFDKFKKNPFAKESGAEAYFDFLQTYLHAKKGEVLFPTNIFFAVQKEIKALDPKAKIFEQEDTGVAFYAILKMMGNTPFTFSLQETTHFPLGLITSRDINNQTSFAITPPLSTTDLETIFLESLLFEQREQQYQGSGPNVPVTVTKKFINFPDALAIFIKRGQIGQLNTTPLTFSPTINLDGFGILAEETDAEAIYECFGCVLFGGTLKGGHYIAQVKYGTQWYECSDEKITQIGEPFEHDNFWFVAYFYSQMPTQPISNKRRAEHHEKLALLLRTTPAPQRQPSTAAPHTDVNQALARFNSQLTELTRMVAQRS